MKLKNQIFMELKTQIVMKLKNSNCDESLKIKYDRIVKKKLKHSISDKLVTKFYKEHCY